jgi:heme/copper-type cytochrome/quinol oxidase subunit 3
MAEHASPTLFTGPAPSPHTRKVGAVGLWLMLASLTMLFLAGMLAYIIIRLRATADTTIHMPPVLWVSTAALLLNDAVFELAWRQVARQRLTRFKQLLVLSAILLIAFVATQTWGLLELLADHWRLIDQGFALYGMVFMLVLLHAMHIVGGLIPFAVVVVKGFAGRYDHEHAQPVRFLAIYWHFLDVVWIAMFGVMLIIG